MQSERRGKAFTALLQSIDKSTTASPGLDNASEKQPIIA